MTKFALDESFGYIIRRTDIRLQASLRAAFKAKGYDITPEQWGLLNRVYEKEGQSQRELGTSLFKGKPNTTKLLAGLEKKGMIVRKQDASDRRIYRVYLTPEGRTAKEVLTQPAVKNLEKAFRNIDQNLIPTLVDVLNQIYENVE